MILILTWLQCRHLNGSRDTQFQNFTNLTFPKVFNYEDPVTVLLNLTKSNYTCDEKFLGVTIGISELKHTEATIDLSSPKLQIMAQALSPTFVRLGGTLANFLIFDPNGTEQVAGLGSQPQDIIASLLNLKTFNLTGERWLNFTAFFKLVGWDLIFNFNQFLRKADQWDPTNAALLLKFSQTNKVNISGFQIGNEPSAYEHDYNVTIPPAALYNEFTTLRNILNGLPRYWASKLFGPDVTRFYNGSKSTIYLQEFLKAGACDVMDYITFHHYYMNSDVATLDHFISIEVLDSLKECLGIAKNIMLESSCSLPLALSETSSFSGGGAPELSDRYVAGFMWLDKLGLSAQYGLARVFRQTFFAANYALISSTIEPNPDFYLTVLFKRLVQGPVLTVLKQPDLIRVYANCASTVLYPSGAIVIYFLNLRNSSVNMTFPQFANLTTDIYLLTPGDSNGLRSSYVKLNGKILVMTGLELPSLLPRTVDGAIPLEPYSFGFLVVPNANVSVCLKGLNTTLNKRL
nr:heparanase-like isoform X1 [Biomphalaria glabrata]